MKGRSFLRLAPWRNIHKPLPFTPRQSEQLLNALTSSFRRQLDQEHPSSSPPSEPDATGNPLPENQNSSVHATDKHLQNILDNPLFRVVPSHSTRAAGSIDRHKLVREPMAVFDDLVASGSVTTGLLERCLRMQHLLASRETGNSYLEAMKESRAGSKVVDWWFASGSHQRKMVFKSKETLHTLVKFMVAEGLQDTAMVWLDLIVKRDLGGDRGRISSEIARELYHILLLQWLRTEIEHGGGWVAALQFFSHAGKRLPLTDRMTTANFNDALRAASKEMTVPLKKGDPKVPVAAFEEFLDIHSTVWPKSRRTATLPLYHPTQPDPTPFLQYSKRLGPDTLKSWSDDRQSAFMLSGFDALRVLMDQGRSQDVSDLALLMQQALPSLKNQKAVQHGYGGRAEALLFARLQPMLT